MTSVDTACVLCSGAGGHLVYQGPHWRVIQAVDMPDFAGVYRVIWNAHVAEFSDLAPTDQRSCMQAVAAVERVLRDVLQPAKINLASLGNVVPHLHWHVIPRFDWDSRYPAPAWAAPAREVASELSSTVIERLPEVERHLVAALQALT